jgi:hypothetical protein
VGVDEVEHVRTAAAMTKMAGPDDRIFLVQLGVVHCRLLKESFTDRWVKEPWTHVSVRTARGKTTRMTSGPRNRHSTNL